MRRHLGPLVVLGLGLCLAPAPARADTEEWASSYDPGKPVRRGDFAAGLTLGGAVGGVSGYPNEIAKLDDPRYEANTGVGGGPAGGLFIGGALRDWFVFGIGFESASVAGNAYKSSSTYFILHVEAYPLFSLGGPFHDLGLVSEFGAGGRTVKIGGDTVADGGLLSIASVGAVYEPFRLGSFSFGPIVTFTHQGSQSLQANYATIGLRSSFYGGP
ncbi:MAG TPA: hypothetical protein VHE30_28390 [Polyangiaceae bacterium]|nr:hypothetical protein [Polyangiaceae bacterium]